MSYRLVDAEGDTVEIADCIYDFNHHLASPFPEPIDGDWHSLDDEIEDALADELDYTIEEIEDEEDIYS